MKKFKFNSYNTRVNREDNVLSESDSSHQHKLHKRRIAKSSSTLASLDTRDEMLSLGLPETVTISDVGYVPREGEIITWRGRVLELKKTVLIAELVDSSKLRSTRIVKISYDFHGQNLRSYSCNTRFTLQQTIVNGKKGLKESSYTISRNQSIPIDVDEVKRTIERQMNTLSYMFSDD